MHATVNEQTSITLHLCSTSNISSLRKLC